MRHPLKVLKRLYKQRELSVEEFLSLFPRRFNDHRDFYLAANLINDGYIGRYTPTIVKERGAPRWIKWSEQDVMEIAIQLHINTMPEGADPYQMPHANITIASPRGKVRDPFYCPAKTDLFFQESLEKREERLFAILIAIFAAAVSAAFTTLVANVSGTLLG